MAKEKDILMGFAALAIGDVKDAKRRYPDSDLTGYAESRDLQFLGNQNPAGYFAAVPALDLSLQFNVMRGVLPGGRHGILFHHRLAWPCNKDGPIGGTFYGVVFKRKAKGGLLRSTLFFVPVVGDLVSDEVDPDGPMEAVGIPVTDVATLVPEAAALKMFSFANERSMSLFGKGPLKLEDYGSPGWIVTRGRDDLDLAFLERFLTPEVREALAALDEYSYSSVRVDHGTLIVRVNGYLDDPATLDKLGQIASVIGDALASAALTLADPKPFETELPAAGWGETVTALGGVTVQAPAWQLKMLQTSEELGMALEDPAEFHRAFPTQPVPGQAYAVFRSSDNGKVRVRVAALAERRNGRENIGRNAVIAPAVKGAKDTAPGWVRLDDAYTYAVKDGLFAVWFKHDVDLGDFPALIARAKQIAEETGLAAI